MDCLTARLNSSTPIDAECVLIYSEGMAIHSSFLGSVTVSGDEAKALTRRVQHARGTKAANEAAANGRKLVSTFAKKGVITIKLKAPKVLAEA